MFFVWSSRALVGTECRRGEFLPFAHLEINLNYTSSWILYSTPLLSLVSVASNIQSVGISGE